MTDQDLAEEVVRIYQHRAAGNPGKVSARGHDVAGASAVREDPRRQRGARGRAEARRGVPLVDLLQATRRQRAPADSSAEAPEDPPQGVSHRGTGHR